MYTRLRSTTNDHTSLITFYSQPLIHWHTVRAQEVLMKKMSLIIHFFDKYIYSSSIFLFGHFKTMIKFGLQNIHSLWIFYCGKIIPLIFIMNIVVDTLNYFQTFKQVHCWGYKIIMFREKESMNLCVYISNI